MGNGNIQLPPDGTGKKTQTFTFTSGSSTIHQQAVVLVDATDPTRTQKMDQYGSQYVRFNEGPQQLDALGNSKFSQTQTVANYDFYYGKELETVYDISVNGASSQTSSAAGVHGILMSVNSISGSRAIRRTNKWHKIPYSCGGLVEMVIFHGDDGKVGNVRRWGYYDDEHGFMFQLSGSNFYVGTRTHNGETWVSQSEWNVDPLNGTGQSLFTATPTGVRRYWINFKPLGGEVKFGVYNNTGDRVIFHEMYDYYMRRDLPLTWENFNIAGTSGTSEMTHGNAYVTKEGVDVQRGRITTTFPNQSFQIPTGENVWLMSVRPRTTFNGRINRVAAIPKAIGMKSTHPISFRVIKNATLTGATWNYSTLPSSSLIGDVTATSGSGGITIASWYVDASGSLIDYPTSTFNILGEYLHQNAITGSFEQYSLVLNAPAIGAPSASVDVSITWEEVL